MAFGPFVSEQGDEGHGGNRQGGQDGRGGDDPDRDYRCGPVALHKAIYKAHESLVGPSPPCCRNAATKGA